MRRWLPLLLLLMLSGCLEPAKKDARLVVSEVFDDSEGVYAEGHQQRIRVRSLDEDDPEIDESIHSTPREFELVSGEYVVSSCADVNFSEDTPCRPACSTQIAIRGRTELIISTAAGRRCSIERAPA